MRPISTRSNTPRAWLKRYALANYCPNDLSELHTTPRNELKSTQKAPVWHRRLLFSALPPTTDIEFVCSVLPNSHRQALAGAVQVKTLVTVESGQSVSSTYSSE